MSRAELESAWRWREEKGLLRAGGALRVFHGPGEGTGALAEVAVDRFGDHYWVTEWGGAGARPELADFLCARGARSAVVLARPERGVPDVPAVLLGVPPEGRFAVEEGRARFLIQLRGARHPGLFLDHAPLRAWLLAHARGWTVLNTFAYTGSLSVAAGLGGAAHVTTLDLARPAVAWARENWELNGLAASSAEFLADDVFARLPRLARQERRFDCVILDPPSFSRGKKGSFSTAKDLGRLHALAFDVLAPGGTLVTSINSANVPWRKFEADVRGATKRKLRLVEKLGLPATFPARTPEQRYLKGLVLRCD
jgi:23S rRNA (cytosine1962-C5)-methyltransferase